MAEIIKFYKESFPALRLIGKRYTDKDRNEYESFSWKWDEWFRNGYFDKLEKLKGLPENENAYVGCMRCSGDFEYWIGIFFPEGTEVPEGYEYADIPSGEIATSWVYGKEDNGDIYGQKVHDMCMYKIAEAGYQVEKDSWVFERYNCPRFTNKDADGKVILDYCIYLKK